MMKSSLQLDWLEMPYLYFAYTLYLSEAGFMGFLDGQDFCSSVSNHP
jgi:hypothetical protein